MKCRVRYANERKCVTLIEGAHVLDSFYEMAQKNETRKFASHDYAIFEAQAAACQDLYGIKMGPPHGLLSTGRHQLRQNQSMLQYPLTPSTFPYSLTTCPGGICVYRSRSLQATTLLFHISTSPTAHS
jgi:hypothetical protein